MKPSLLRAFALVAALVLVVPGCDDGDGGAAKDATAGDAPGTPNDGGARDATDAATSSPDAATSTDTGTAPDLRADTVGTPDTGTATDTGFTTVKAAWTGSYAVYLNDALDVLFMLSAKLGMEVQLNVPKTCPEGGTTLLAGPGMTDTARHTVINATFTFAKCKINGLTIDGVWTVKSDTTLAGGTEDLAGPLTYDGFYTGTCATMVRRTIAANGSMSWSGSFCGIDVATW